MVVWEAEETAWEVLEEYGMRLVRSRAPLNAQYARKYTDE